MASTSGTKKPEVLEKTYLPNPNSGDEAFDFSFVNFSEETFKIHSKLYDDHFLNLFKDENILRRSVDRMVDDGDNPGGQQNEHVHLDEDDEDVGVEYKAFRDGWNRGCRRVIGLDGTILKGQINGEILTAIGRDADNHVYPISWEVVNDENKDNWTWFIEKLVVDLDLGVGNGLVVISDQHMVVADLLPHVEHRQCARHIFENFKKKYTGLEKMIKTCYNYLMERKPEALCIAFFSHGYACEVVENGISECFNGMIKEMQKKPLLTMLEEIRIFLMKKVLSSRLWTVVSSQGDVFETRHCYYGYKVDLATHTCTCKFWMLSGIPCVHVQVAIKFIYKDPNKFISSWFYKDNYVATYMENILLVPRTVRCGNCQELGDNKVSCTNGEVLSLLSQKRGFEDLGKDRKQKPIFDQFPPLRPAISRRDGAPPVFESGGQDYAPHVSRSGGQDGAPPISEVGGQDGTPPGSQSSGRVDLLTSFPYCSVMDKLRKERLKKDRLRKERLKI
uniref:SWIM-type domain-containing protein n=1 Tax=Lactuca sativa TaxID=4236 RepID=A0A9R1X9Q1_LACSA|nr:hypothetical protein LSAT_V11C500279440 [Lactuca sativa]